MSSSKTKKTKSKRLKIYRLLKGRLSPPRLFTFILGFILWLSGVLLYFCLPQNPNFSIAPLIISCVLLFAGSLLKEV